MNRETVPSEVARKPQEPEKVVTKKYNLLIVDDEESLRTLLESELVASSEFAVDTAADGSQAMPTKAMASNATMARESETSRSASASSAASVSNASL